MVIRGISGSIFVIVIVGCILLPTIFLACCLGIAALIALYEFNNITKSQESNINLPISLVSGLLLYLALIQNTTLTFNLRYFFIGIAFLLIWIYPLFNEKENPLQKVIYGTFSILYCVIPFVIMTWINEINVMDATGENNHYYLLYLLILVWTNDTFAYLTGRFFGKHKLFERISPKKTWEGFFGGIIFSIFMGWLISFFGSNYPKFWIIAAILVALGSALGDLFESMIKRSVNVKDSGALIPGHGGILDRFDAAMFAAPIFLVWYLFYFE